MWISAFNTFSHNSLKTLFATYYCPLLADDISESPKGYIAHTADKQ